MGVLSSFPMVLSCLVVKAVTDRLNICSDFKNDKNQKQYCNEKNKFFLNIQAVCLKKAPRPWKD